MVPSQYNGPSGIVPKSWQHFWDHVAKPGLVLWTLGQVSFYHSTDAADLVLSARPFSASASLSIFITFFGRTRYLIPDLLPLCSRLHTSIAISPPFSFCTSSTTRPLPLSSRNTLYKSGGQDWHLGRLRLPGNRNPDGPRTGIVDEVGVKGGYVRASCCVRRWVGGLGWLDSTSRLILMLMLMSRLKEREGLWGLQALTG